MRVTMHRETMKTIAHVFSAAALAALFACGDDDSGSKTPATGDGGTSSTSSSGASGSSSGATSSGGSSSSGASGTATQEQIYCGAVASRSECGKAEPGCAPSGKCIYAKLMKPEATAAYADCFGAPRCMTDDRCVAEAGLKVGGAAASDFSSACLNKMNECGTAFTASSCVANAFAFAGVGEAVTACLGKSCAEAKDCFTAAYAPLAACK